MTDHGAASRGQELGPAAAHLVAGAEAEARALGHDRVGTEHLLLAVLADESTSAGRALTGAGATLAMARYKVREARSSGGSPAPDGSLPLTDRAGRALGRSVRFARSDRADGVATHHVLLGVLDVEGTAGQVLRGLGVDVHALQSALDGSVTSPDATAAPAPAAEARPPRPTAITCASCRSPLDEGVVHRSVRSVGTDGLRSVVVYACPACGAALGASPA